MKSKTFKLLISVILLVATLSPVVYAPYDTASPSESSDDAFRTGIGAYFGDTHFLAVQDETVDTVTGVRFRGVAVPQDAKINNATLFVYNVYDHGAGSVTVTLTGDDSDNSRAFNDSGSFNRIYTGEYVAWDISDIRAQGWYNISITEIVQEIISRPGWSSGNSLSLLTFGESGSPRREFTSEDSFYASAYIEIWYDEELTEEEIEDDIQDQADDPYNDTDVYEWEKNETYRGIDIYTVTAYGDPMFQGMGFEHTSYNAWYYNVTNPPGSEVEWDAGAFTTPGGGGATTPILGVGKWTLILADPGDVALHVSDDEMVTFLHYHPNDAYGNLASYAGNTGSMAIDPDGETIHLVYTSVTPGQDATYNVVYTNFTLDMITGIPTFAPSYTNLSQVGDQQNDPVIYVQPNGTLHVAYSGEQGTNTDQIWYRRRLANGTWLSQVRVSDTDVALDYNLNPDVVVNDETGDALIVWTYDISNVHWDIIFPNNTASPADRDAGAGRYPSMVNDRLTNTANMVYQLGASGVTYFRNKTISNSSSWSAAMQISPAAEKHKYPDIGIDPKNRSLSVVWYNDWNEWTAGNWWKIGQTPTPKKTQLTNARLLFNFIEEIVDAVIIDQAIFLVYPNGTLVTPDPLDDGDDPHDAIDDLLGGAQPEDPELDKYGTIGKFRWKLLIMAVGFVMLLGSPMAGIHFGASTGTWIKLIFVMCFGLAILSQLKFM